MVLEGDMELQFSTSPLKCVPPIEIRNISTVFLYSTWLEAILIKISGYICTSWNTLADPFVKKATEDKSHVTPYDGHQLDYIQSHRHCI